MNKGCDASLKGVKLSMNDGRGATPIYKVCDDLL